MSPLRPFNLQAYTHGGDRPETAPPAQADLAPAAQGEDDRAAPAGTRPATGPGRSRLAANFGNVDAGAAGASVVRPTPSDSQPQPHARKRAASPVTRALDILDCDSESDSNVSDNTHASLELKLLKAILADRKTKKAIRKSLQQQQQQQQLQGLAVDAASPHGSPATPSTSCSQSPYRSQYSPDKYASPTRRSLRRSRDARASHELHARLAQAPGGSSGSDTGQTGEQGPAHKHSDRTQAGSQGG